MAFRTVQLTDWLPPEFSAVSQYALLIAREEVKLGSHMTVVGLSTSLRPVERHVYGAGTVEIIAVQRPPLDRQTWTRRLAWTIATNFALVRRAWPYLWNSDVVRFTGAPPFLIYWLVPINLILRKQLLYRITDFYPECIFAALKRKHWLLELFQGVTNILRRRIAAFEVLGDDMRARLLSCGVDANRIALRRDGSPVAIRVDEHPVARPEEAKNRKLLLYSGNWGIAHDIDTFFEGYRRHHQNGSASVLLWLNATGSGAEEVDRRLRAAQLPFIRQRLVPLDQLPRLLVTPDAHLVTLKSEFMGFVLPSKIYSCIESRRPILFIGPCGSDVHKLCIAESSLRYQRVEVGEAEGVKDALDALASGVEPWQVVQ